MALTLNFGNLAFGFLSVSFIQILKAFAPVVLLLMLFVARMEQPSTLLVLAILLITCGTVVAALGEIKFHTTGFLIYMIAEFCECGKLLLQQALLTRFRLTVWESMYYISPAALFFLAIPSVSQIMVMTKDGTTDIFRDHSTLFVWSGVLGCAVNLAGYCVIKTCSSLTLRVVEGVRSMCVVSYEVMQVIQVLTIHYKWMEIT